MKTSFFLILNILIFWSCNSKKEIVYKKFDDPKTKFKIQVGLRLPILSEDKLSFTENEDFKKFSKELKEHSFKSILNDTCVILYTNKDIIFHKKRYCFFLGHLSTLIEQDTIKSNWKDKKNKNVYFEYQTQIGYHENGKIKYFVNWLSGNKLNYDFEIGTKYFFDEEGRLIDSLNLDDYFQTDIKKIYKKLYEFEEPYNFENINYIDRTFDNNNSFWIISYNNQRKDIIIDDKTLKIYFIKDFDNEILSIYKNFDFKYLYNREPQTLLRF